MQLTFYIAATDLDALHKGIEVFASFESFGVYLARVTLPYNCVKTSTITNGRFRVQYVSKGLIK